LKTLCFQGFLLLFKNHQLCWWRKTF
jgi:hypothetical protein